MVFSADFKRWLLAEFEDARAGGLLRTFLRSRRYQRAFALRLLALGRGSAAPWPLRRLAAWLLQHHLCRLAPAEEREHDFWLEALGIAPPGGRQELLPAAVLTEGFTRRDRPGFITEFQRRLARPGALFRGIHSKETSEPQLKEFLTYARQDCRLVLARYLFSPAEVLARVERQVRSSSGMRRLASLDTELVEGAAEQMIERLPAYEAAILRGLRAGDRIYWVGDETRAEINSLVEAPLGTVVLVVKPPGSDLEIELKRTGRRGPRPLGVVFQREGKPVPPSHRLDAGARLWSLQWEARASARLARVYRLAQAGEAPLSTVVATFLIQTVPKPSGEAHLLEYFTDPEVFGPGYAEMRAAMKQSTAAFESELGSGFPPPSGEYGETMSFLHQVAPGFGILSGTSAFRLDRLAEYLGEGGAEQYFRGGLRRVYTAGEAKSLADTLLSEVLGVFVPPSDFGGYGPYLRRVFAQPENRARADRVYLSLVVEIARFWGTLLAARGFSNGESFVARNVGLKAAWRQGEWQVRPVFLDHDDLQVPGPDLPYASPPSIWYGTLWDRMHILGSPQPGTGPRGEIPLLQAIYRVEGEVARVGETQFLASLAASYRRTQQAIRTQPALRELFHEQFLAHLQDWDQTVALFLRGGEGGSWESAARDFLTLNGHSETQISDHMETIRRHAAVLRELSLLYLDPLAAP